MAASSEYRPVSQEEGQPAPGRAERRSVSWVQSVLLFFVTVIAGIVLLDNIRDKWLHGQPLQQPQGSATVWRGNGTWPRRRRKRWSPLSLGRMGTSSSFVFRSKRSSIKQQAKQAAKAATRTVLLVGSQHALGNELLKHVFGELCQRSRLALRCEPVWGMSKHDLKALAKSKGQGRRRLVWLESDAARLLRTMRGVRAHASDYRVVHILWDPARACVHALKAGGAGDDESAYRYGDGKRGNLTVGGGGDGACERLGMEAAGLLFRRAKRLYPTRVTQPRLEDLVSRKSGGAAWARLFKFLELPEKAGDLSSVGAHAVAQLNLRSHVLNRAASPSARAALEGNATLRAYVDRLRSQLDYAGLPATAGSAASASAASTVAQRPGTGTSPGSGSAAA